MLITATTVTEYPSAAYLAGVLASPLLASHAVIVPTAKRRHILPTAEWGHLATEGLVVAWNTTAAARLANLAWLRSAVGATWPQLSNPAPPHRLLATQPPQHWNRIMAGWSRLQPWRKTPPLWAAAQVLTKPE
jgi:hypothetical protein